MNKVKIMLATIAGISAVGGAFALKAKKGGINTIKTYAGTVTSVNGKFYPVCDHQTFGTILPSYQLGSVYGYYVPSTTTKVCTLGYYTINE